LVAPWSGARPRQTAEEDLRRHYEALCEVVRAVTKAGQAVIVGRGAQTILANRRDVLHVRIVTPLERRIAYVASREGLSPEAARDRIRHKDDDRARYLQSVAKVRPDDPHLYDLVVNTGVISLDQAVEIIVSALAAKGERLAVPEAELGPGAGLGPYPAPPGEVRIG
jgi:cytidylate kinase